MSLPCLISVEAQHAPPPPTLVDVKEMQDMALDFLDPAYYGIQVGQAGQLLSSF